MAVIEQMDGILFEKLIVNGNLDHDVTSGFNFGLLAVIITGKRRFVQRILVSFLPAGVLYNRNVKW